MNIFAKNRRKIYYIRIISIISVTFLVFFFFVDVVNYIGYKNILTKNMNETTKILANGLKKDIDIIDNSMRDFCEYMYIDDYITGKVFANSGNDEEVYSSIYKAYTYALTVNNNIESIQFYNAKTKKFYSIGKALDTNENQLKSILSDAQSISRNNIVIRTITHIENLKEVKRPVFSYFIYASREISEESSFMAVNIDAKWLMESISKYSKLHDEHSFIIYSSNRALILADNRFERHKQAIIDQIESGKKSMKIKGEKYMILNTALNTQELYVLSIIPYSGVYGDLTRYSVGMIILSFFILLCGILISVITARKIYFPFDAMYRSLFKEEDSITDNNEIEQIKLLFGEYSKKIDMYGTESEKNKRIIEEYSINKLLKNSNELSSKDIEKIFSLISLSIEQDFAVVVLSIDEIDGETNYIDNIINYALYNISLELIHMHFRAEGEKRYGRIVEMIINVPEGADHEHELENIMHKIQEQMMKNFNAVISMSTSGVVHNVTDISDAEAEALENLLYRFNYGYGRMFCPSLVNGNKNNNRTALLNIYENMMLNAGNENEAKEAFKRITDDIEGMNYMNAVMKTIKILRFLNEEMQINIDLPFEFSDSDILTRKTLPEIYGEVCDKLNYRFMNEENKNIYENKQMRTVYEIKKYIEENYHRNTACIAELSDRMKISQKRLRETFKKSENISFAAYLTKFRIEKAKEYILTTDLNFSKISEKIGISNDTYFYKLFKDECGMTPSEFKKYGMARKKETEN